MEKITEVQKEIENNVRNCCKYVFNDPQTGVKDTCSIHGCHCVAIDSPYTFVENGQSICKIYNEFSVQKSKVSNSRKKICEKCGKTYVASGNRQKYCEACAAIMKKASVNNRKRKSRKNKDEKYMELMK